MIATVWARDLSQLRTSRLREWRKHRPLFHLFDRAHRYTPPEKTDSCHNLVPFSSEDCGHFGITPKQCKDLGCCWKPCLGADCGEGLPSCYYSTQLALHDIKDEMKMFEQDKARLRDWSTGGQQTVFLYRPDLHKCYSEIHVLRKSATPNKVRDSGEKPTVAYLILAQPNFTTPLWLNPRDDAIIMSPTQRCKKCPRTAPAPPYARAWSGKARDGTGWWCAQRQYLCGLVELIRLFPNHDYFMLVDQDGKTNPALLFSTELCLLACHGPAHTEHEAHL